MVIKNYYNFKPNRPQSTNLLYVKKIWQQIAKENKRIIEVLHIDNKKIIEVLHTNNKIMTDEDPNALQDALQYALKEYKDAQNRQFTRMVEKIFVDDPQAENALNRHIQFLYEKYRRIEAEYDLCEAKNSVKHATYNLSVTKTAFDASNGEDENFVNVINAFLHAKLNFNLASQKLVSAQNIVSLMAKNAR